MSGTGGRDVRKYIIIASTFLSSSSSSSSCVAELNSTDVDGCGDDGDDGGVCERDGDGGVCERGGGGGVCGRGGGGGVCDRGGGGDVAIDDVGVSRNDGRGVVESLTMLSVVSSLLAPIADR